MVKATEHMLFKCTSALNKRSASESIENYLKRMTHLYLDNKEIDDMGDILKLCPELQVLYLYDNKMDHIPLFPNNINLTHLYLQNNEIRRISHLQDLKNLQKLFLSGNRISVLEGLECLEKLTELKMDLQRLPPGESLIIDDHSLKACSKSLKFLDLSRTKLSTLNGLEHLEQLEYLSVSHNDISQPNEILPVLSALHNLKKIELAENPVLSVPRIREAIIFHTKSLELLDGKPISTPGRQFIENWCAHKIAHGKNLSILKPNGTTVS
ncbi:unnamed protein product [Dibothriocephalus latus]|uniref:Uncharacterized protein n=1 Tax=Dibothriocephalus latus TaxID=60516 RepID=A0A3P7PM18_DIBLA|nr:unnamed protein product [Dibothriocephalus latus]